MIELIALYIVCKNIGKIARSRRVPAGRYQLIAVALWIAFEFAGAVIGVLLGGEGIGLALPALLAACCSLPLSFMIVRRAGASPAPRGFDVVHQAQPVVPDDAKVG